MQNHDSRLKIHTHIRPQQESAQEKEKEPVRERKIEENRPVPSKTGGRTGSILRGKQKRREQEEPSMAEKLLRNTAVACALLLTVMSLKNVDQPWSRKVTEGLRQAMTMRIDWDETLGRLSFVRALMPETALVFLNLGDADLTAPAAGEIVHEYLPEQPWIEYSCPAAEQVLAATDGVVTAAGQGAGGEWIVLILSEEGVETVYGYLDCVYVQAGQTVRAAQQIGATKNQDPSRLYFEVREEGEPVDPSGRIS